MLGLNAELHGGMGLWRMEHRKAVQHLRSTFQLKTLSFSLPFFSFKQNPFLQVSKASCFFLNFNFKFPGSLVPFNYFPNMVSFARGQFFPSSDSSNSSSSTSTSSSSLSSGTLRRLETHYVNGSYHTVPFVMSYLGEGGEKGDTAIAFDSPTILGVSWRWKRILAEEVDKEEDKEESMRPHPQRRRPQTVPKSSVVGIFTNDLQNSPPAAVHI